LNGGISVLEKIPTHPQSRFNTEAFLQNVVSQSAEELTRFFAPGAVVYWRNTDEKFTAEEYVLVNCKYPGDWNGVLERVENIDDGVVTIAKIWSSGGAFRVVSFITLADGKITCLDEYWGDIAEAPEWRREMKIGKP
jgi:hypothetical protein